MEYVPTNFLEVADSAQRHSRLDFHTALQIISLILKGKKIVYGTESKTKNK